MGMMPTRRLRKRLRRNHFETVEIEEKLNFRVICKLQIGLTKCSTQRPATCNGTLFRNLRRRQAVIYQERHDAVLLLALASTVFETLDGDSSNMTDQFHDRTTLRDGVTGEVRIIASIWDWIKANQQLHRKM